jgi:nitrogen fixation protein FixH
MNVREKIWPALIVLLLVGFSGGTLALARIAASDPHAAIEPDYYKKAVAWDSTMAQERRNTALAWHVTPSLPALGAAATSDLVLDVRDGAGAPVTGAVVHVEAMPVSHADAGLIATLADRGAGAYGAPVAIRQAGLWELRVSVVRGADKFTTNLRLDAARDVAAHEIIARPGDANADRLKAGTQPAAGPGA